MRATAIAGMVLLKNDGGLLPAPARVSQVDLAPAERVDLLLDLRGLDVHPEVQAVQQHLERRLGIARAGL